MHFKKEMWPSSLNDLVSARRRLAVTYLHNAQLLRESHVDSQSRQNLTELNGVVFKVSVIKCFVYTRRAFEMSKMAGKFYSQR